MNFPGEKLVIKLWETVAEKGIGSLFKPWQIRREGRASIDLKREELLAIAQAENDAEKIRRGEIKLITSRGVPALIESKTIEVTKLPDNRLIDLEVSASSGIISETIRKESNVTRALLHAEQVLETDDQPAPQKDIDDDWLFRWRDNASEVSSDELRSIWGKVLAGEVKAPGSYSLRTLEFLRNLSKEEAEAIAKLSRFVIDGLIFRGSDNFLENEGINFDFLLKMQDLGVISGVESRGLNYDLITAEPGRFIQILPSNSMCLVARSANAAKIISMPAYKLTLIGLQVLRLGEFEPHIGYLKLIGAHLKSQGVSVTLAKCTISDSNMIQWSDGQDL
jgi:hypothetical protein